MRDDPGILAKITGESAMNAAGRFVWGWLDGAPYLGAESVVTLLNIVGCGCKKPDRQGWRDRGFLALKLLGFHSAATRLPQRLPNLLAFPKQLVLSSES